MQSTPHFMATTLHTEQFVLILASQNYEHHYTPAIRFSQAQYNGSRTCRLLRGSIFMTGPTVLSGRLTSMVWLGLSGVGIWRGPAGARPKLQKHINTTYNGGN